MKILLFDVDGTLCESGKIITDKIANAINGLFSFDTKIGLVGGGTFEKILLQLNNQIYPKYIFSECGSVVHILNEDNKTYKLISKNNIRQESEYIKINLLIKSALKYLSNVDYLIAGHFIDLRNGLIYISLVGMSANDDERNNFIKLDKIMNYRKNLIDILLKQAAKLKLNNYLDICIGGSVGIALYPKKWNKIQVLKWFNTKSDEIHYFGDKYLPNGNDFEIMNNQYVIPHCVDSPDQTINEIYKMLNYN